MLKNASITVGIPAHNEEKTIASLIKSLLRQKHVSIEKIIVVSDGSTDKTASIVNAIKSKKILCIETKNRGKAAAENRIIREAKSDILVLFDADIQIEDTLCMKKLIEPIVLGNAEMTSCSIAETPSRNFFERSLELSMQVKRNIFASWKNGANMYSCYGPARALNKKLYKSLHFPFSEGEDMYSYLWTISLGKRFAFVKETSVKYTLPSVLKGHVQQSMRFQDALLKNSQLFSPEIVQKEMKIPVSVFFKTTVKSIPIFLSHPFETAVYVSTYAGIKTSEMLGAKIRNTWHVHSTKGRLAA